ncbi:MAG: glycosyltransferase, partial [Nitrococcus sp.]|nr:glycosyltransferase [Nitrococcus sp.]
GVGGAQRVLGAAHVLNSPALQLVGLRRSLVRRWPRPVPTPDQGCWILVVPGRLSELVLAPLLDLQFNLARSYTKFFDIVACGAVGIFSPGSACAEVVRHGVDGWVAEMDQEAWVDAILLLARDEIRRSTMLAAAQTTLHELTARAGRMGG